MNLGASSRGKSHSKRSLNTGPSVSGKDSVCLTTAVALVNVLRTRRQKLAKCEEREKTNKMQQLDVYY